MDYSCLHTLEDDDYYNKTANSSKDVMVGKVDGLKLLYEFSVHVPMAANVAISKKVGTKLESTMRGGKLKRTLV